MMLPHHTLASVGPHRRVTMLVSGLGVFAAARLVLVLALVRTLLRRAAVTARPCEEQTLDPGVADAAEQSS
jgi:hypothetical protein